MHLKREKGIKFAHYFNSELILLNVHEEFMNKREMIMSRVSVKTLENMYKEIASKAQDDLKKLIHDFKGDDIKVTILISNGKASKQIVNMSITHNADLIIMGINGKDSISDYILGTTTENVINKSIIPVITIPGVK
tara:strand:+ start:423 stop:830 length:408 start_codon:yes stop_codon:yes gene_type:complete